MTSGDEPVAGTLAAARSVAPSGGRIAIVSFPGEKKHSFIQEIAGS